MRTCTACGRRVDADPCPSCGAGHQGSSDDGLLLPSGPLGALATVGLALLLGAGVWGLFVWLSPEPAATAGNAAPVAAGTTSPTVPTTAPAPTTTPLVSADPGAPAADWETLARRVSSGVVSIRSDRCGARPRAGAGFLISQDRLVTAAHLVRGASTIRVLRGDEVRTGRLVATDDAADVAMVALDGPLAGAPLSIVPAMVGVDDDLAVVTRRGDEQTPSARTGSVLALDLVVDTQRGALGDVLTLRQPTRGLRAGAAVVTADGALAGMTLVNHVRGTHADTTHVLSGQVLADRVATWTGEAPATPHQCETSPATPEPTSDAGVATGPTSSPTPTPPVEEFVVTDAASWVAVVESFRVADNSRAAMEARTAQWDQAMSLPRQGIQTLLLRSDDWPSLESGLWVLHLGPWPSRDEAGQACAAVAFAAAGCYPAPLER